MLMHYYHVVAAAAAGGAVAAVCRRADKDQLQSTSAPLASRT